VIERYIYNMYNIYNIYIYNIYKIDNMEQVRIHSRDIHPWKRSALEFHKKYIHQVGESDYKCHCLTASTCKGVEMELLLRKELRSR